MTAYVFKRYELKYLLSHEQYATIKGEIETRLCPDAFRKTTVQSLYFDTENDRLIRASDEKPIFKEKLRARCYGLNDGDKDVFVEMKRKYDGVVYKRRIACKEDEIFSVLNGNGDRSQIGKELRYFTNFYGTLRPKTLILCEREAFCERDGDLRVTFDENVRYRTDKLDFRSSLVGENLLKDGTVLMELKTGVALPLWLCRILDGNGVRKQSFSKIGVAYRRELSKNNQRSKTICLNQFSQTERQPQSASLSLLPSRSCAE